MPGAGDPAKAVLSGMVAGVPGRAPSGPAGDGGPGRRRTRSGSRMHNRRRGGTSCNCPGTSHSPGLAARQEDPRLDTHLRLTTAALRQPSPLRIRTLLASKAAHHYLSPIWLLDLIENCAQESPPQPPAVQVDLASGRSEGAPAQFTLGAAPAPAALPLGVEISQTGDFAAPGQLGRRTVTLPAGGSASVSVATVNDQVDEPVGQVTLPVLAGQAYRGGLFRFVNAAVLDDDPPPARADSSSDSGGANPALSACVPLALTATAKRHYRLNRHKAPTTAPTGSACWSPSVPASPSSGPPTTAPSRP